MKYCVIDCFNMRDYFDNIVKATATAYRLAMWCSYADLCDAQTGEVLAIFENSFGDVNVTYY